CGAYSVPRRGNFAPIMNPTAWLRATASAPTFSGKPADCEDLDPLLIFQDQVVEDALPVLAEYPGLDSVPYFWVGRAPVPRHQFQRRAQLAPSPLPLGR